MAFVSFSDTVERFGSTKEPVTFESIQTSLEKTRELLDKWDPYPQKIKTPTEGGVGSHRSAEIRPLEQTVCLTRITTLAQALLEIKQSIAERFVKKKELDLKEDRASDLYETVGNELLRASQEIQKNKGGYKSIRDSLTPISESEGVQNRVKLEIESVARLEKEINECNQKIRVIFKEIERSVKYLKEAAPPLADKSTLYETNEFLQLETLTNLMRELFTTSLVEENRQATPQRRRSVTVLSHNNPNKDKE